MENHKKILGVLQQVHSNYEQLKNLVEKSTNKELDNILYSYFEEFGSIITTNFHFMELIVTRIEHSYSKLDDSNKSEIIDEELEKYFVKHWDFLFSLYKIILCGTCTTWIYFLNVHRQYFLQSCRSFEAFQLMFTQ